MYCNNVKIQLGVKIMTLRNLIKSTIMGLLIIFFGSSAFSADYPSKSIKLYIGYKAGGELIQLEEFLQKY